MGAGDSLIKRLRSEDPAIALTAANELRTVLQYHERRGVLLARRAGMTWQQIADLLGVGMTAVYGRYRNMEAEEPGPA